LVVAAGVLGLLAAPALGASGEIEHFHFHAGAYHIRPGANQILLDYNHVPTPHQDGFMIRMAPNIHYAKPDGSCCAGVPRTDVVHLHHGVWLSNGEAGRGEGNGYGPIYPFMATGEERTVYSLPAGYGYPVGKHDLWILNYMIHDLWNRPFTVYITYDIDFVPMSSPLAASMTPVHPIWMDVEDHHIYPVFNVKRYSGKNGKYTFPDMAKDPYGSGSPLNEFTIDHPGTLIGTAGHLHPGGLYDDLDLIRAGATARNGTIPGPVPHSVRLFRSSAHYWDPRGPISWDMAMGATAADWHSRVEAGDTLRISATYETKHASWYEVMGIMVVWEAWNDESGVDPFTHKLDERGHLTHGHLASNNNHGGIMVMPTAVNASSLRDCRTNTVMIAAFRYNPGDLSSAAPGNCIPTVRKGHSLTFINEDAVPGASLGLYAPDQAYMDSVFHSVSACAAPCNLNTGISYPLENGATQFDSQQLGAATPGVGRLSWSTPTNLKPGTYYFFCRIHPFMRGVFRII
jgi:hypothetical protein